MKDKLEIFQKKDKGREDSFWYEGDIAKLGKYLLIACGEIKMKFEEDGVWYKGDNALIEAGTRGWTDKELMRLPADYWDMNNWFEVILPDGESVMGDVAYDYDNAIKLLKQYHKEKI